MQNPNGLISKTLDWVWHPSYADSQVTDWLAFLTLILIASFLWSTVIRRFAE